MHSWRVEGQLHLLPFDVAVGTLGSDVCWTSNKSLLYRFVSSTQPEAELGSLVTRTFSTFWSLRVAMNLHYSSYFASDYLLNRP